MWNFNSDINKWLSYKDELTLDNYNFYKQELQSVRLYSKCLSGATFLPLNDTENIYDVLGEYEQRNWYISPEDSPYTRTAIPPQFAKPIGFTSSYEFYTKYISEYGLTLKNHFTPNRLIREFARNYIEVDVATTTQIDLTVNPEIIDGVKLLPGHRVLVKDQRSTVNLLNTENPEDFIISDFEVFEDLGATIEYIYYDETNGIYEYDGELLVRNNFLDDYRNCLRMSVLVKLGEFNKEKQFHLTRLRNGYFPTSIAGSLESGQGNDPMKFVEKKNWILRNRVDYNNLFEINYFDVLKIEQQSYFFEGVTYSIPVRTIAVGEFGIILNTQNGVSNIINNKYKVNLRSISQTEKFYFICGDDGIILRIRKHDFLIERIEADCNCPRNLITTDLNCIHFFNELKGVVVGELNTILVTKDGGTTWKRIRIPDFDAFTYTQCLYYNLNSFFIAGYNGIFIEFTEDLSGWNAVRRRISRFIDDDDEYLLVDNINSILKTEVNNWGLSYSFSTQSTATQKDLLFLAGDDSKIIVYDINNSIPDHDFLYLDFSLKYGDVKSITRKEGTNEFLFTGTDPITELDSIYSFNLNDHKYIGIDNSFSNTVVGVTPSTFKSDVSPNKIKDYKSQRLFICGNNSLLLSSSYSVVNFEVLDATFESKLKSKLLFLDYDIASKLVFFTDFGDYRLPNSVTFSSASFSSTSKLEFKPLVYPSQSPSFFTQSEVNWWAYWQDVNKTFEYYATYSVMSEEKKVLISGSFSYSGLTTSYTVSTLTTDSISIKNLAPTIVNPTSSNGDYVGISSRYNGIGLTSITAPTASYDLYICDYMTIARFPVNYFAVDVGDLIYLQSSVVDSKLLVNKIVNFGSFRYVYMFNDFNGQMINDLQVSTYSITLTNLNKYKNVDELKSRFSNHPISLGYNLDVETSKIEISSLFNNYTAYYNLATTVELSGDYKTMSYTSGFLNFGYTPTYNILDYLENINDKDSLNPIFRADKQFLAMPHYERLPLPGVGSLTDDKLYISSNGITYSTTQGSITDNKIFFGISRKLEWESLFINTFIDITIYNDSDIGFLTERMLILDKYFNEKENYYVIEFHKNFNFQTTAVLTSIDIKSRRTLLQISSDLQELNNIQRPRLDKNKVGYSNYYRDNTSEFYNYEREIKWKISTDSYAKILLSDAELVKSLSAIIYTDDKNELVMNITNLGKDYNIPILNTANFAGELFISCSEKHELTEGEGVVLEWTGGTGSSQTLNQQYFGYFPVHIISDYNFTIGMSYGVTPIVGNDKGIVKYSKRDPFFNYQPVDILDLGINKRTKQSVELKIENVIIEDNKYKLRNVDYNKYRFRLVDLLNIESLNEKYPWIFEAEITDAIIGEDVNGLVWYTGNWECGRWFGGTWISGAWASGDWYGGQWKSLKINDRKLSVEIDEKSSSPLYSTWFGGRWYDGTWDNGLWVDGRWYGGNWNDGIWYKGIWNDGTWNNGYFTGGVWILGTWNNGYFNCDNNPSYWLDGKWFGGDFENGMWYNGLFDQKDTSNARLTTPKKSRFGTRAFNSRTATWHGGKWANGSFYSKINVNDDGKEDVSDVHKYSIWYTGQWLDGDFYGGIAYNMDFKSGTWYGGILDEIQIIGMNSSDNYFITNGIFKFNIGDEITVTDCRLDSPLGATYGTNFNPKKYTVLYTVEDSLEKTTNVYVATNIVNDVISPTFSGLWIVSRFKNVNWKSGIWTNGIYESGVWEGGIWYNGVFEGTWM